MLFGIQVQPPPHQTIQGNHVKTHDGDAERHKFVEGLGIVNGHAGRGAVPLEQPEEARTPARIGAPHDGESLRVGLRNDDVPADAVLDLARTVSAELVERGILR